MKLALIGPAFFGYLDRLGSVFEARGIETLVFDERPSNHTMAKLALRLGGKLARGRPLARAHHAALLERLLAERVTHVLMVSVELIPARFVEKLRNAGVVVALYAWDSFANKPQMKRLARHADAVASFDPSDCRHHGLAHIPLFSTAPGLPGTAHARPAREVDFLFCGTLHSGRPRWLARIRAAAEAEGRSLRTLVFYHGRGLWMLRNLGRPDTWGHLRHLSTRALPLADVHEAMTQARVVIDLPHPAQSGLTMRSFEALSQGAVVLSSGPELARTGLTGDLAARVWPLRRRSLVTDMGAALEAARANPGPPVPEDAAWLSADRFASDVLALFDAV